MDEAEALLRELKLDPVYHEFCSNSFDAAEFASRILVAKGGKLHSDSFSDPDGAVGAAGSSQAELTLQAVGAGLGQVKVALKGLVGNHRQELAAGMRGAAALADQCEETKAGTADLRRSLQRIRSEVLEPYDSVRARVLQLQHIGQAQRLLKRLTRAVFSLRKLKQQASFLGLPAQGVSEISSGAPPDGTGEDSVFGTSATEEGAADLRELATAAQSVFELERLFADSSMAGIELVEAERGLVRRAGERVRRLAGKRLEKGLQSCNQAEMAGALQVFQNLRCLPDRCHSSIGRLVDKAAEITRQAFDARSIAALIAPPPAGIAQAAPGITTKEAEAIAAKQLQNKKNKHCEELAASIHAIALQALQLQQVLMKKQDPTTQEYFIEVLNKDLEKRLTSTSKSQKKQAHLKFQKTSLGLFGEFWVSMTAAMKTICREALVNISGSDLEAVAIDLYPSLRKAMLQLSKRLLVATKGELGSITSSLDGKVAAKNVVDIYNSSSSGIFGGMEVVIASLLEIDSTECSVAPVQSDSESSSIQSESMLENQTESSNMIKESALEALEDFKVQFLNASLCRLINPVEQMFPEVEGFGAAIPSRHDLNALMRTCAAEMKRAGYEAGGEPTLGPLIAKGVLKTITMLAHKVEGMACSNPAAFVVSAAILSKPPADEFLHQLQLLKLIARLSTDIESLPLLPQLHCSQDGSAGMDTEDALSTEEIASVTQESQSIRQTASSALSTLAFQHLIEPYFLGVAHFFEELLADVHKEHFGEEISPQSEQAECSLFLSNFQNALQQFLTNHLSQFPDAAWKSLGLMQMSRRLLFSFVSHLALIRPLSESGRLALAKDLTVFEAALGALSKVNELGSAYNELRSFRQFLFLEGSPEKGLTCERLLNENCIRQLRPSTVFHQLLSKGPDELISPHISLGVSSVDYVRWLIGDTQLGTSQKETSQSGKKKANQSEDKKTRLVSPSGGDGKSIQEILDANISLEKESESWNFLNKSIDVYFQRISVAHQTVTTEQKSVSSPLIPKLLLALGPSLLAAFQETLS